MSEPRNNSLPVTMGISNDASKQKRNSVCPEVQSSQPDPAHANAASSSDTDKGGVSVHPEDIRSKLPQRVPQVESFSVEASHYDNGLIDPTNQSWHGFQTTAKAREAIANLITWPPYAFRRIILQDLSNPEEPQYSMLRDGPVKGGRKDAVFTLQKIAIDEREAEKGRW